MLSLSERPDPPPEIDMAGYNYYINNGDKWLKQNNWHNAIYQYLQAEQVFPTDSVKFVLHKGGSVFPDDQTFPGGVIGTDNNEEFNFTFSLPLVLAANDELEILLINLNSSGGTATINKGYFSVTKLH